MREDFNWGYSNTTKQKELSKFCDEIEKLGRARPELIAEWYGHALFDLDKTCPRVKEIGEVILKFCDEAHYWGDCQDPNLRELKKEDLL